MIMLDLGKPMRDPICCKYSTAGGSIAKLVRKSSEFFGGFFLSFGSVYCFDSGDLLLPSPRCQSIASRTTELIERCSSAAISVIAVFRIGGRATPK